MSLSVGEMRGYCYLMSTPPPPSGFSTIFFKLHRCTEDVHLVWSIVVNLFFFLTFFQLVNLYLMPISDTMCIYL